MSYAEYKVKVHSDGSEEWLNSNGQLHREDGPARVCSNGTKTWFKNGLLHRGDGPAVVHPEYKAWYKNGKRHREDGPAIVHADGTEFWYKNGKLHREDGPAIVYVDGTKRWYLNGIQYTEEVFLEKTSKKLDPCDGKFVEIDGKKYQLSLVD